MAWLLTRALVMMALALAGAGVGELAGRALGVSELGPAVGAALGAAVGVMVDGLRALRLMKWLRRDLVHDAPRGPGFWGEIGYRVERALRQREHALAQEQERFAQFMSAIEASPNGVLLLDAADQIQWLNATAAAHFGLDPARDLLQRVTNLVRAPSFVAYLQAGKFDDPVVFSTPGCDATLSVLVSRYGDGMRLALTQDITERERTEAMRRDFVANVSHEIRTPLTVLAGFVETIATLPLTNVERERVLGLMTQQTTRMTTLVEDLLTLAKLEGSPRPTCDRWTPVSKLFLQVETEARGLSAGRHALHFEIEGTDEIAGNDSEWTSAVANLVSNAVRYTPPGGAIAVRWIHRPDGNAEIDVKDTGPGIAREHIGRLTERFYRVDGSRSRETGGTGLGLSIVKHVVQRHGGELDIHSELGRGSIFRIVVPAARVRPTAPAQPQATESSATR